MDSIRLIAAGIELLSEPVLENINRELAVEEEGALVRFVDDSRVNLRASCAILWRMGYRVDGTLREVLRFSSNILPAIAARIKVLCNLNIAESRFPQDGRFSVPLGTAQGNFRVSFMPCMHRTKIVTRILGSTGELVSSGMRSLIAANTGSHELTEAAMKLGYQPLRYDGLKKALLGLTTLEEVVKATPLEWSP